MVLHLIYIIAFLYKKKYQIKQFHFLQFNLYPLWAIITQTGYYFLFGRLVPTCLLSAIQLYIFCILPTATFSYSQPSFILKFFSILKHWRLVLPFAVKNIYILFKFVELCCQVLRLDSNLKECIPCLRGSFLKLDSWLLKYFCSMYRRAIVSFNVKRVDF